MAALIRQANSGYKLANKPKIKTKDVWWKRRERKQNNNNKQTLSEKKEEAGNVSEQRDKGWIHVIRLHGTIHLAVTTTLRGSRRSRDYPPHLYIVNDCYKYNPRNKRASKEKKKSLARTGHQPNPKPREATKSLVY